MANIGYATLSVIPVMRGVAGEIERGLGGLVSVGRRAGQQVGQGIADGVEAKAAAVEKASEQVTKLRNKEQDAAGKLRAEEAKLQTLRERGVTDAGRIATAEERVSKARRDLETATRSAERGVEQLARIEAQSADDAADAAEETRSLGDALDDVGDRATSAGTDLAGMALAAAGIGSAMDLAMTAMDFESATAKMNAQLGATGELAEMYGSTAGELWTRGLGTSMEDVTAAVGAVAVAFPTLGSEGEVALDKAAERAMNLATIFDTDVNEVITTTSQLITEGLAKDSTEAMDLLTTAMQRVGPAMGGELPAILDEYTKHFATFGMSGQEAMGILVEMAPQGAIALDKTGDAIKELSIRATDGSKATIDAMTGIGLNGEQMAATIARGGPAAGAAMREIAGGLLSIEDPSVRAQQAIALFGTPLEDLGVDKIPAFLEALSGGSGAMAGFEGAADQAGAVLNDTAQSKLSAFGRELQSSVIDKLGAAAGYLDEHRGLLYTLAGGLGAAVIAYGALRIAAGLSAIAQGIQAAATGAGTAALAGNTLATGAAAIAQGIISIATGVWAAIQWVLNSALLANPITWIVIAIVALIAIIVIIATKTTWFQTAWEATWNAVKIAWNFVWNLLKAGFNALIGFFTETIPNALGVVKQWFIDRWNDIKSAFESIWNTLKGYFESMCSFFTDTIPEAAGKAKDWVVEKFDALVGFVTELPGKISSAASGMWDGIKEAFRDAVNFIIRGWNKIEFKIPGFKVGPVGYDGFTLGLPDIPPMRAGGTVRQRAGRHPDGTLWGPGNGTSDSILGIDATTGQPSAWVSAGEGVVHERAMEAGGSRLVAAMNDGWVPSADYLHAMTGLPRYATGGTVGGDSLTAWEGGGGEAHLKPPAILARRLVHKFWSAIETIGGWRASDPYPDHPSGRALDIMIPGYGADDGIALGTAVRDWLHDNKSVLGLNYLIWRQNYEPGGDPAGGNLMPDRGSDTQNHFDHVHALFDPSDVDPNRVPDGLKYPAGQEPALPAEAPGADSPSTAETSPSATQPADAKRMKSFRELGQDVGGIMADGIAETLGLPSWITDPAGAVKVDSGDSVRTTDSGGGASTTVPDASGAPVPGPAEDKPLDAKDYAGWITKAAKDLSLPRRAAVIGTATGLVESGDPMRMYANAAVPESLQYPHDAVGQDNDSIGLFQQRESWGTVKERMDPYGSARLFYDALVKVDSWESMPEGDAAQAVQRSAYPAKYALRVPRAGEIVDQAGLYDRGGWLAPGGVAVNQLRRPEPVLHPDHWDAVLDQNDAVRDLVGAGAGLNVTVYGQTTGDIVSELRREQWRGAGGYGSRGR